MLSSHHLSFALSGQHFEVTSLTFRPREARFIRMSSLSSLPREAGSAVNLTWKTRKLRLRRHTASPRGAQGKGQARHPNPDLLLYSQAWTLSLSIVMVPPPACCFLVPN